MNTEIRDWVEYQKSRRHGQRITNQREFQRLYEDDVDTPLIKDADYRVKLGIVANMANGITQQVVASLPKVYIERKKDDDVDIRACDRVGVIGNILFKNLTHEGVNPFRETFKKKAFTRGESWIHTPWNEFLAKYKGRWQDDYPDILPVRFILYDPMVVFADPSEEVNGEFPRVAVSFKRTVADIKYNYPNWKAKGNDEDEVEFLYYVTNESMDAEADKRPVLADAKGNLLPEGRPNILGFVPFSHAYSGYGTETEGRDPALLTMTRTGMIKGKIVEAYTTASNLAYGIHAFSFKHRHLIMPTGSEELADGAFKDYHPNKPGQVSVLFLPDGSKFEVAESQEPGAATFAYNAQQRSDLASEWPSPLRGDPAGLTSGRMGVNLGTRALSMYDAPLAANDKVWADALKKAFRVFDKMSDLLPPGLQKGDFQRCADIIVNTEQIDPDEERWKHADIQKQWSQGFITHEDALIQMGETKEKAKEKSIKAWVEQIKRNNPELVQMMVQIMAQEMAEEDRLEALRGEVRKGLGAKPITQYGSRGGPPREQAIETPLGREMGVEEARPVRESPR